MKFRFLAIKLFRTLVTMWLVVTFTFIALRASGDPIEQLLGDEADPEVIEYYRKEYGLDKPMHIQYLSYFAGIAKGDLGFSFSDERDAVEVVAEAIPNTLLLGFTSFSLSLLLGIPMGVVAALNRNKAVDRFVMGFAVFGFSIPNFFLGILLILTFSLWLRVLPSSGIGTYTHMIMPVITLGTSSAGTIARFARSSVLEILNKPFIQTALAKGVSEKMKMLRHVFPNAAIPIVTIIGFRLGDLIAGSIITEAVFAWPGVGRLLVSSVSSRDLAIVQTILLMVGGTMALANLAVDLTYGWLDPRIRTRAAEEEGE